MKYKIPLFGLVFWLVLFVFLQINSQFHFFYIEQNQLFQSTWDYIGGKLIQPGGLTLVISEFLVQFFILPYAGAAITATIIAGVGMLTALILKRIAPTTDLYILYVLPALTLLFIQFDFNYFLWGSIAFILFLSFFYAYIMINSFKIRLIYAFICTPLLFWWGGPVFMLFTICIVLWEIINRTSRGYWIAFIVIEMMAIGWWCHQWAVIEEYKFVFLPDAYFLRKLPAPTVIYYAWISIPSAILIAFLFRKRKAVTGKRQIIETVVQFIIIGICWWQITPQYMDKKSDKFKRLDYYTRTQQWNNILEECKGTLTNYLYLYHLNMALFETNQFADRMFAYHQRGVEGLMPQWNQTAVISTVLAEINFTLGNVALAQEMAFESFVSSSREGNPRMLKRLVQTNLIYGTYAVAEKYIDILENTYFYKDWAKEHRRFLYNDSEVESDSLLGAKRKCLIDENYLSHPSKDYVELTKHNPSNRRPLEFLMAFALLSKELGHFKHLIETHYGTEALPTLPIHYQEAIITLSENDPDYWKQYDISETTRLRFAEFKKQVIANKNSGALHNMLYRSFGDTYWFYFMFYK